MHRALQERLAVEIDDHIDRGTTTMAAAEMANPIAEYLDPAHHAREQAELFRRLPIVVGHASQVPRPRDFLTDDLAGVPVLVVRQEDGSLKAFLNVCRHRGAKVAAEESGHRRVFSCPYHAWAYDGDGALRSIPNDDGFCDLDRSRHGLVELPVEERHGLVWVVLTPGAPIDVASHLGGLDDELAGYGLDSYVVERQTVLREDVDWKLVVDGFLETYHLRFLHATTVGPYIRSNCAPFEACGPHGRMVTVRTNWEERVRSRPAHEVDYLRHFGVVYQVFPNTVLVWQTDHFEAWTVFPDGAGRSASRVSLLTSHPTASPEEQGLWDKNWKILMSTVLEEDFVVARSIQAGFSSGAQDCVTFGRNEPALQHFHGSLRAALDPLRA